MDEIYVFLVMALISWQYLFQGSKEDMHSCTCLVNTINSDQLTMQANNLLLMNMFFGEKNKTKNCD